MAGDVSPAPSLTHSLKHLPEMFWSNTVVVSPGESAVLPITPDVFKPTDSSRSISSLSDDESPVFRRHHRVAFVDVQTVASSSVRLATLPFVRFRRVESFGGEV